MALSNSQYHAVMRDYEQQQLKNRHDLERRVARVYEREPRIQKLDEAISTQAADCARKVLGGDSQARLLLRRQLDDLRQQKALLLQASGFPADYMEMQYRCPHCRDTGYADGRRCHCFEQERIRILYAQSNIREVLEKENFGTLSFAYYDHVRQIPGIGMTELDYMKRVVRQCREFAEEYPHKGRNLLFTGTTGVGKTFLANCIARAMMDRYYSVICLSSQDLFEMLSRHKFSREAEEEVEESCRHILECDMLIVDDLGTEVNNTFVSSQLFYCINERIVRERGTIISTNLSVGMLRDAYSDRVTSRIMSHYAIIPLYGGDIRMKKRSGSMPLY